MVYIYTHVWRVDYSAFSFIQKANKELFTIILTCACTKEDDITFDAGGVISFSPKVKNIVKEEDWKGRGVECLRSNAKPQRCLSVCCGTPDFSNPYWYNVILMLAMPVLARLPLVNIERYRATREYWVTFQGVRALQKSRYTRMQKQPREDETLCINHIFAPTVCLYMCVCIINILYMYR